MAKTKNKKNKGGRRTAMKRHRKQLQRARERGLQRGEAS